jgi:hypothetical protein
MHRFFFFVLVLSLLPSTGSALATAKRGGAAPTPVKVTRDTVEGGDHWRLATANGPVHVWRPQGYRRSDGGIVVFVHGYNIGVDQAWQTFGLAQQFKASRQNAIFIVPEAPTSGDEPVNWKCLGVLLDSIHKLARIKLPRGHIVLIGHSGAFRTLVLWLDYRWVDHVILLDALYANELDFRAWLDTDKRAELHRMTVAAVDTLGKTEQAFKGFKPLLRRKGIPHEHAEFTKKERRTRLLVMRSQYGHNELVVSRRVIPILLRLSRLNLL